jgi:hypothetical protein
MNVKKHLRKLSGSWRELALCIADFQAALFMTLVYFIIFFPLALMMNVFIDPMGRRSDAGHSSWRQCRIKTMSLKEARRQY